MRTARLISLMLAVLLLGQSLPVWGQGPPSPQGLPTILAFDRKLCPFCHQVEVTLEEIQKQYPGQLVVRLLFIDEREPMFKRFHIAIVPTQVFLDPAGKEVFRHEGVYPKEELIQKLKELKFIRD